MQLMGNFFRTDGHEKHSLLQQYEDKLNCSIRIDEPSGDSLILDVGNKSFRIDSSDIDDFKGTIV